MKTCRRTLPARHVAADAGNTERRNEGRFRALFDHARVGIAMRPAGDLGQRWTLVNDYFCEMLGYTREELLELGTADITLREMREQAAEDGTRLSRGEIHNLVCEKQVLRKDGHRVWVALAESVLPGDKGSPGSIISVYQDITARKALEAETSRKTELAQLLQSLARAASEAPSAGEAMRQCIELICAHGKWPLGHAVTFDEIGGTRKLASSLWHSTSDGRFSAAIACSDEFDYARINGTFLGKALREGCPVWIEDMKAGPVTGRTALLHARGLQSGFCFPVVVRGETLALLEFFSDTPRPADTLLLDNLVNLASQLARLIERERAQAASDRLAAIVEHSSDAIFSRTLDGVILSWNAGAEQLYGYTAAEAVGKNNRDLLTPPDRMHEPDRNRDLLSRGLPVLPFETIRHDKEGKPLDVWVSLSPIFDTARNVVAVSVIARDISEQKRLEHEARLKTELAQLLEALARTANEAAGPEDAMLGILERIRKHGDWDLAHLLAFEPAGQRIQASFWHGADVAHYKELTDYSDGVYQFREGGNFTGRVLADKQPVWIDDISGMTHRGRLPIARRLGLHAALALPVIVGGNVAAILEFFSRRPQSPDPLLLENFGNVASQLARLIERTRSGRANALLAAIVENSNDAIIARGIDRRITSWNAAAERLFGWPAAEAIGQCVDLIIPPDQRDVAKQDRAMLAEGLAVSARDVVRVTRDGRRVDLSLSQSPIKDVNGSLTGVSLVFRDISERKKAEKERAQLAAIVESTTDAIVSRDLDGNIQSWNDAAESMFGWTALEAVGRPIGIIVPPERRGEMRPIIDRMIGGESVDSIESSHRRKDGTSLNTSVTFSPIRNPDGRISAVSLIYRDITERKRLEQVALDKARLTQLLEALARTANEAAGPEEAMRRSLELICDHGQWTLGCVGVFGEKQNGGVPRTTYWHAARAGRYDTFIARSDATDHAATHGHFVGKVLREKRPVWISDIAATQAAGRIGYAAEIGLQSAFAFPVIVGSNVAAFLEFFAVESREPDELMLEAIASVGAQLARLIERERSNQAIRVSESRLRAILDNEPECVKVITADGTPMELNKAGLRMLECESLKQASDHGLINFVKPEYREKFRQFIRGSFAGGTHELEFEIIGLKGTRRWMQSYAAPIHLPEASNDTLVMVTRDVTERKDAEERANHLAHHDGLTGLPNRGLFSDRLKLAVARAKRHQETLGIMVLNIDRFKQINEALGIEAGDELLRQVAARIRDTLRDVDTVARLDGDEFAVLLEEMPGSAGVAAVGEKLGEALQAPFRIRDREIVAVFSIGIALYPNGTEDPQGLLEHAEAALERVKREGGGGCRTYESEPITNRGGRFTMETGLRYALERGEFELHYQPKVRLSDGTITGAEALLRWNNPQFGAVSPAKFIPVAEETGLIVPIGEWVLREACARARAWNDAGMPFRVAVNLSARQFRQKDLVRKIADVLGKTGLAPGMLELEVTESTAMTNPDQAIACLKDLRALGTSLAVDDFGTGYSSLTYLKRLPLDVLKIDRSFLNDMATSPDDLAIVKTIIALAHSLNLHTVAEGVERENQANLLKLIGCDEYQGFLFSKPLPAAQFSALLGSTVRQPNDAKAVAA
jgi:diguanylate cyclase (GGDEF)-like protein/PAS domain S-box-containing protein